MCSSHAHGDANRPNVLFILADDLGWSDTTLFGTTTFYKTPNIERLATRGMTFTRAYSSSPLCSPTRASILTGLSPARHGPPVAGWQGGGTCTLSLSDHGLLVTSVGGDPHLSFQLPQPLSAGPMTLHVSMKSTSSGSGQAFWKVAGIPFAATRSVPIPVVHDGTLRHYAIPLSPQEPVEAIRIDPSRGTGTIEITGVRLKDAAGTMSFQWSAAEAIRARTGRKL
jgi:hypothetical protein